MAKQSTSPYSGAAKKSFWKMSVGAKGPDEFLELYSRKYEISSEMKIATAGSCFAQHIALNMRALGYKVLDCEPPPEGVPASVASSYGYGLYSARYGNIYHARQLLQLTKEALGTWSPADAVWERNGRYFDALRPAVEPSGLPSPEAVRAQRAQHLQAMRLLLEACDVFVFTFGLTEAWRHKASGTVYPTAPGTIAGAFDENVHEFINFSYEDILGDFKEFMTLMQGINPDIKFLVTVSPVPLAATATNNHVLPATIYSKSVLRAVAGSLFETFPELDYFPSYEIITNVKSGNRFYDPTSGYRNVTPDGVKLAMSYFFSEHGIKQGDLNEVPQLSDDEMICEEMLLEDFGK